MLESVLVPTDMDEGSDLVMRFVKGLPTLGTRKAVLCHVARPSVDQPLVSRQVEDLLAQLQEVAAPLQAALLQVETHVPAGDPKEQILSLARQTGSKAIVCGSHARKITDDMFSGSVSDSLLRDPKIPTMCARFDLLAACADPSRLASTFASRLLLPTDFSETATKALDLALGLPRGAVSSMHIMHSLDPSLTGWERRKAGDEAELKMREILAKVEAKGFIASSAITDAEPVPTLLAEIERRRVTGVIVGTHGRTRLQEALFGSVSMALLRQANCPVLIVS